MKKYNYFQNVFDQQLEVLSIGELENNAPTIVLLHEGLGSLEMWKDIPERLFKELGLNIFVYSRAGYGKSSTINLPRPINYMNLEAEKYLPKLLSEFNLNEVFLLGHSDGATIAAINSTLDNNNYEILGTILIAPFFIVVSSKKQKQTTPVNFSLVENLGFPSMCILCSPNPFCGFLRFTPAIFKSDFKTWCAAASISGIVINPKKTSCLFTNAPKRSAPSSNFFPGL